MPPSMKMNAGYRSPPKQISEDQMANDLLEMRSKNINHILQERDRVGHWGTIAVDPRPNPQAEAYHKALGVDKVVLVKSPFQIDTTPGGGIMPERAQFANPMFPNRETAPAGSVSRPVSAGGIVGIGQAYGRQLRGGWPAY